MRVYMPDNDHGVAPGYYTQRGLCHLLRKHKRSPRAVQFIADMLE